MKRSTILAAIIAIAAIVWMGSGIIDKNNNASAPQKEAVTKAADEKDGKVQSVQVSTISAQESIKKIYVSGRTEASKTARISAEVNGQIAEFLVDDGALVKENEVIAKLKIDDREVALRSAQKRVTQRELEYKTAKNLVGKGFSTEVQVATQRAELELARAELRRAELALKNTQIRAPFDGVLEERDVEKGDYVTVGDPIAHILDLDPINVVAYVAEQRIQSVSLGQEAFAKLPNGDEYKGHVSFISRTANSATRTFRVEIEVENSDLKIADGLTAEVTLMGASEMAHRVSPAVLTLSAEGDVGIKYIDKSDTSDPNGFKVMFKPVIIKSSTANEVWVSGLPDPVSIITIGQEFVSEGQVVQYVESKTNNPGTDEQNLPPHDPEEEDQDTEMIDDTTEVKAEDEQ
jgi:multidrug efflux system membrane fusion protein